MKWWFTQKCRDYSQYPSKEPTLSGTHACRSTENLRHGNTKATVSDKTLTFCSCSLRSSLRSVSSRIVPVLSCYFNSSNSSRIALANRTPSLTLRPRPLAGISCCRFCILLWLFVFVTCFLGKGFVPMLMDCFSLATPVFWTGFECSQTAPWLLLSNHMIKLLQRCLPIESDAHLFCWLYFLSV